MDKRHLIGWISEWNNYQFIVNISMFERMVEWGNGREMTGKI